MGDGSSMMEWIILFLAASFCISALAVVVVYFAAAAGGLEDKRRAEILASRDVLDFWDNDEDAVYDNY